SVIHLKTLVGSRGPDLLSGEVVTTGIRLIDDGAEVIADRRMRLFALSEPLQLRMMRISAAGLRDHRLGEQPLPPAGRERLAIEVPRMHRPQPHEKSPWAVQRMSSSVMANPAA